MRSEGESVKPWDSLNEEACEEERRCEGRRKCGVMGLEECVVVVVEVEVCDMGESSGRSKGEGTMSEGRKRPW